jgi:hypothetical protein
MGFRDIPYRWKELIAQSTVKYVVNHLDCLDIPQISKSQREENYRVISDISWNYRHLLYDFFKKNDAKIPFKTSCEF